MKGDGNDLKTLLRKLYFMCLPTQEMRNRYIYRHRQLFHHIGKEVTWQSRHFPADPEFIHIGNNVRLAANVRFINHDAIFKMLNNKYKTHSFKKKQGCIRIGDNVVIGANVIILPNINISDNCIVGGGECRRRYSVQSDRLL